MVPHSTSRTSASDDSAGYDTVSGGRGFVPPGKRFHLDKDDDDLSDLGFQS
jgi:hypothetical protein